MMTRRQAIKTTALLTTTAAAVPGAMAQMQPETPPERGTLRTQQPLIANAPAGPFTLPPLPYAFDALEPHIDAQTMQIHHDKHHATYVTNLNKAIAQHPELGGNAVDSLLKALVAVPDDIRTVVRNNGGGHYNHSLFWQMMKKNGGGEPKGELAKAIDTKFKSFSAFKDEFTKAALGQFGSGWAWLELDGTSTLDGGLKIEPTPNQDSPLLLSRQPLLGIDVWEHAYYLKYQNKRADYVAAWWNVVNWDFVSERFRQNASA
jgi:Fe-Mn family superoxide dismutase